MFRATNSPVHELLLGHSIDEEMDGTSTRGSKDGFAGAGDQNLDGDEGDMRSPPTPVLRRRDGASGRLVEPRTQSMLFRPSVTFSADIGLDRGERSLALGELNSIVSDDDPRHAQGTDPS